MKSQVGSPIEILLVEDNPGDARLYKEMLVDLNRDYHIVWVQTLAEALAVIEAKRCDMILSDLGLPDSQGLGTAFEILGVALDEPIIILTGQDDDQIALGAIEGGVQDYLLKKTITPELLDRTIRYAFERKRVEKKLRRREKALREEQQFTEQIMNTMVDTLFIFDPNTGKPLRWNRAFRQQSGFTDEEIAAKKAPEDWYGQADLDKAKGVTKNLLTTGHAIVELSLISKDGTLIPTEYSVSLIRDARGKPKSIISMGRDVTERRKIEEEKFELDRQRQQMVKAESLARMAGAIAHHYNNLMAIVMGNLEMALMSLPVDSEFRFNMTEAMSASRRAADLSGHMLSYLGQSISERKPIVLMDLCRDVQSRLPETLNIYFDMGDTHPVIQGNAEQIRQVLTNLVNNAEEAITDQNGEIRVNVSVKSGSEMDHLRFYPPDWKAEARTYACISVQDTGSGMDADTLEKMFDPFFTTRFTGRGLGLPVALGIVKAHGGTMTVESEPGKGSRFCVYLPLVSEAPQHPRKTGLAVEEPGQKLGTILVVDDEPMIRNMSAAMLNHFGWDTIAAADGRSGEPENGGSTRSAEREWIPRSRWKSPVGSLGGHRKHRPQKSPEARTYRTRLSR